MKKMYILIAVVVVLIIIGFYTWPGSPDHTFLKEYASMTLLQRKEVLFENGFINEATIWARPSDKDGVVYSNPKGGYTFVKEDRVLTWDGTADGNIEMWFSPYSISKDEYEKLTTTNWIVSAGQAKELGCIVSFPVRVDLKKFKDVYMGQNTDQDYSWWYIVIIPNELLQKASFEDLVSVFRFVFQNRDGWHVMGPLQKEMIEAMVDPVKAKDWFAASEPILKENYANIKKFAQDFSTYTACESKLSPEELGSMVPVEQRAKVIKSAAEYNK